ncbi:MAG: glycosyl transferase [Rhodospirillales bacterium]|nr:glycosyl transferase [Rhodospirillales bacterium]
MNAAAAARTGGGKAAVLLAARDGARFLPEQLASLEAQTYPWDLWWHDDGSQDATPTLLAGHGHRIDGGAALGAPGSFFALLRAAAPTLAPGDCMAFADQDDVWLPEKLARGAAALARVPPPRPAIYAARQIYTDASLRRLGVSPPVHAPGFPAALTQNIAIGCTVMLNAAAAKLVAASHPPALTLHDWWSYILVTAAGGAFVWDDEAVVLYRQHPGNLVGVPQGVWRRGLAALRRGPGRFMDVMRAHLAALEADAALITPSSRATVATLSAALAGGGLARARALAIPGLHRQTALEDWVFRLWFLVG